jgi:DNA polymerase
MFVEEIPTEEENKSGLLGGKFWNVVEENIKPYNVSLNNIYCTSVIKCRPKQNRYPTQEEVLNCFQYLIEEINSVKPQILVFFGKSCFKYFVHVEGGFETFNKIFLTRLCQKTIVTYNPLSLIKTSDDYLRFKSILRRIIISVLYKR